MSTEPALIDDLFAHVRAEYGDRIAATVRKFIPGGDAADVEAEIWLSIFAALRRYEGRARLGTYIYPIVRRRIADHLRWKYREARLMRASEERIRAEDRIAEDPIRATGLLTAAELRVMREIAQGAMNDQIAGNLCISKHTVRSHVKKLYSKTGATNRAALALLAYRFFKEKTS
jgi:RNA polymerase sigma factor (sigma-70 family)